MWKSYKMNQDFYIYAYCPRLKFFSIFRFRYRVVMEILNI